MNGKILVGIVSLVVVSSIITLTSLNSKARTKKRMEDTRKEYPPFDIDKSFSGVVSNVEHPYPDFFRDNPHQAYLLFEGSLKRRVSTSYELHNNETLDSVLRIGDFLFKQSSSDTLFIYRIQNTDTIKFSFELRDDLGYSLKEKSNNTDAH